MLIKLALKSLRDRQSSVVLSIIAMAVSIFVLLGVEHIRHQSKESFSKTVSGVDLIVGARTGSLNLLLYSVFKIGSPTNNISWQTYEKISNNSKIKWAIPLSLGDSDKGFRVLGTTPDYFEYLSYGQQKHLEFEQGNSFTKVLDVVLGHQVAKKLGYRLGDKLVLAHGIAKNSFNLHNENPFTVVGILAPTGTPIDQSLHISLQGIKAIHSNKKSINNQNIDANTHLHPASITAVMLGLKSKISTFRIQRAINNDKQEPLLAILPRVALSELWQIMKILESTLLLISISVFIAACLGVSAMLLSSIKQRTQEIQLLRVIGAPPLFLFMLIQIEALFIAITSNLLAIMALAITLALGENYLAAYFGVYININIFSFNMLSITMGMIGASMIIATIPSIIAYLQSRK